MHCINRQIAIAFVDNFKIAIALVFRVFHNEENFIDCNILAYHHNHNWFMNGVRILCHNI